MPEPFNNKKTINKPKLVNRGGAGLYGKLTDEQKKRIVPVPSPNADGTAKVIHTTPIARHKIAPALQHLVVPIDSVIYDPDNARLHPERNIAALKESLVTYGQVKPIVVQKSTNHVVAGNGTLQCMRALGHKEVAAVFVDMTDAEAAGYGLADNKTAELAKWDFESDVLKRIERRITEAGLPMTGWSDHDLAVLRMADWIPPETTDEDFKDDQGKVTVKFTKDQFDKLKNVLDDYRKLTGRTELSNETTIFNICNEWAHGRSRSTE